MRGSQFLEVNGVAGADGRPGLEGLGVVVGADGRRVVALVVVVVDVDVVASGGEVPFAVGGIHGVVD